jgi:predicted aspartyl protease
MRMQVTAARLLTTIAAVVMVASPATAQMYRWVDERGGVNYTQGIDSIPERHRKNAVRLDYPSAPASTPSAPAPVRPGAVAVKGYDTVIDFRPGQPIYVVARLNNVEIARLILDTGADRTVITPRSLRAAGVGNRPTASGRIHGATGAAEVDAYQIESIEIGAARVDRLMVLSHDINLPESDGLLGRDFLEHFKVTIDNRAGTVTLAPR